MFIYLPFLLKRKKKDRKREKKEKLKPNQLLDLVAASPNFFQTFLEIEHFFFKVLIGNKEMNVKIIIRRIIW